MRKEYNVKQLKVKRRGLLPGLRGKEKQTSKVRITIALDKDIIDYFKTEAKHPGAFPYQTQINQALRKLIDKWKISNGEGIATLKQDLLNDSEFIHQLADKVKHENVRK